jgi:ATP-dependent exoDNAse (exonuclease V) beta subunit
VIERIASALEIDREADSSITIPAPAPRDGLEARFEPSEMAVRVNLASAARAAELAARRGGAADDADLGTGPAPLLEERPAAPPNWPLSYSAIAAVEGHAPLGPATAPSGEEARILTPEAGAAWGTAVHSLLEWSHANGWREPDAGVVERFADAAGVGGDLPDRTEGLLAAVRAWLDSSLFEERVATARSRSEVPILVEVAGTVLRGSIDLLVESDEGPPTIVDFKTDRLGGHEPRELYPRYEVQRDIYALAAGDALGTDEVRIAYVFLEEPDSPVLETLGPDEIAAGRARVEEAIGRVREAA